MDLNKKLLGGDARYEQQLQFLKDFVRADPEGAANVFGLVNLAACGNMPAMAGLVKTMSDESEAGQYGARVIFMFADFGFRHIVASILDRPVTTP